MDWRPPDSLSPQPRAWCVLPGPLAARRLPFRPAWLSTGVDRTGLTEAECGRVRAHLARCGLLPDVAGGTRLELVAHAALPAETCHLRLGPAGARLEAGAEAGFHRGVELLAALAAEEALPALEIEDAPLHAWRGLMLDCARHFWPTALLERVLEEVARGGGNRLHLHLTDDQGWRLPLPGRPELAETGAWRTGPDGARHGGIYTADALRALVRSGQELGVEILPEVDLPGHCGALLAALPGLSCDGRPRAVPTAWGCHEALLCLGRPAALDFLDELLAELTNIFPFPLVHLGGDEVPAHVWGRCPRCLELARREGLAGTPALSGWWLRQAEARLAAAGRRGAFWDEALENGAPAEAVIFAWRGQEAVARALAAGHETVACPQRPCYLDHYSGLEEGQPRAIGGHNPWDALRAFTPEAGLPLVETGRLLGGQANLWTEYIGSEALLMERLQPRLAALLESLWSGPEPLAEAVDYATRLPAILRKQQASGWHGRVDPPEIDGVPLALPRAEIHLCLRATLLGAQPAAWLDGEPVALSEPRGDASWAEFPLSFTSAGQAKRTLSVRQMLPGGVSSRARQVILRWEAALPALADAGALLESGSAAVRCRWLRAPAADWSRLMPDAQAEPWDAEDLDWPRERVARRLEEPGPGHAAHLASKVATVAPPPSGHGLRRETLLRVEQAGCWAFRLHAHSPARLSIDGRRLIDQDGFRPAGVLEEQALLEQGLHGLRLDWLELRGGDCRLEARGPGERAFAPLTGRLCRPAD